MNKKIFTLLAGWALLFGCASCTSSDESGRTDISPDVAASDHAEVQYQALCNAFSVQRNGRMHHAYPSEYGGAYLGDEGRLTVRLTDDDALLRSQYAALAGSDGLRFERCDYSLAELNAVMDAIDAYMISHSGDSVLDNLSFAEVDLAANRVAVGLVCCDELAVEEFRSAVCDSPLLCFQSCTRAETGSGVTSPAAKGQRAPMRVVDPDAKNPSLYAGERVWSSLGPVDSLNPASVGYRARTADGVYGYVSSGMAVKQLGAALLKRNEKGNWVNVGTVIKRRSGGDVDAVFCAADFWKIYVSDSLTIGNIRTVYRAPITSTLPPVNSIVLMFGAQTLENTGKQALGTIRSTRASFVGPGNVSYTNMIRADYDASGGDAGGLVVRHNLSQIYREVVGIHLARAQGYSFIVPALSINEAFGLTIY